MRRCAPLLVAAAVTQALSLLFLFGGLKYIDLFIPPGLTVMQQGVYSTNAQSFPALLVYIASFAGSALSTLLALGGFASPGASLRCAAPWLVLIGAPLLCFLGALAYYGWLR